MIASLVKDINSEWNKQRYAGYDVSLFTILILF